MTYIHISEVYNRESILKNGLMPSKIILSHHLKSFREYGFLNYDEDKALYAWIDSEKNEKFVKDMVYCNTFLSPRNVIAEEYYEHNSNFENLLDFSKMLNKFLYKHEKMTFDIYKIKSDNALNLNSYHYQISTDDIYNSAYCMDERYNHDDKELEIFNVSQKNISIIGQAFFDYNFKNNKYEVKVK